MELSATGLNAFKMRLDKFMGGSRKEGSVPHASCCYSFSSPPIQPDLHSWSEQQWKRAPEEGLAAFLGFYHTKPVLNQQHGKLWHILGRTEARTEAQRGKSHIKTCLVFGIKATITSSHERAYTTRDWGG